MLLRSSRFRRTAGAIAALASIALMAGACSGQDSASAGGGSLSDINIGAWMPLTGALAAYGVPEKAGCRRVLQDAERAGRYQRPQDPVDGQGQRL